MKDNAEVTESHTLLCKISFLEAYFPTDWNSLSDDLRDPTLSTDSLRRLLKTRLFSEY